MLLYCSFGQHNHTSKELIYLNLITKWLSSIFYDLLAEYILFYIEFYDMPLFEEMNLLSSSNCNMGVSDDQNIAHNEHVIY